MQFQAPLLLLLLVFVPCSVLKAVEGQGPATKATYLVTGLHCPPCTKTVEGSLAGTKGVKSVAVDWRTKVASVEFDESVLPAQLLALKFASTPHMMGGNMVYGGWLTFKIPTVKDEAVAKQVKDTLKDLEGVKQVAIYPAQGMIGIQFSAKGKLKTQDVLERLAKAGLEATN